MSNDEENTGLTGSGLWMTAIGSATALWAISNLPTSEGKTPPPPISFEDASNNTHICVALANGRISEAAAQQLTKAPDGLNCLEVEWQNHVCAALAADPQEVSDEAKAILTGPLGPDCAEFTHS